MQEKEDQTNCEYGHFSRGETKRKTTIIFLKLKVFLKLKLYSLQLDFRGELNSVFGQTL